MRRFSQKNQLVTLNEINITPLLDLAFVLLIIFVITTPMLDHNLKLTLPSGGVEKSAVRRDQVRTIEVNPDGGYLIRKRNYSLAEVEPFLAAEFIADPQMAIYIRADLKEQWGDVAALIEVCRRLNITRLDFATRPVPR